MRFILRLLAVVFLAAAVVVPWVSRAQPRVLVIALDGLRLSVVSRLAREGALPHLSTLLASSSAIRVVGGSRRDPRGYWRSVLFLRRGEGRSSSLWDVAADRGLSAAVVGVPGTTAADSPRALVIPGAREKGGFIGDNVGARVSDGAAKSGAFPWPYASVGQELTAAIRTTMPGLWSDWILLELPAPDSRRGFFRVHRSTEGDNYVSPVYRRAEPARKYARSISPQLLYVPDNPSWTSESGIADDVLYSHACDLTAVRAEIAGRLISEERPSLLLYYEALPGLVEQWAAEEPENVRETGGGFLLRAYEELDRRIGTLTALGGGAYDVMLIGREPGSKREDTSGTEESPVASTGFVAAIGRRASLPNRTGDGTRVRVDRIAAAALALVGVRLEKGSVLADSQQKSDPLGSTEASAAGVKLSSGALRELGLLSASSAGSAEAATSVSAASSSR